MTDNVMKPDDREPDYKAAMLYHSDRADAYMAERDAALTRLAAAEARAEKAEQERDRVGLEEKMRMVAWCSKRQAVTAKAWQRAAQKALAGDLSELRNRIAMIDAGPLDIVLSSEAERDAALTRLAAAEAQVGALREQLAGLEKAASEVSRRGAVTGPQWTKLTIAILATRAALRTHEPGALPAQPGAQGEG